jgi:HK97 family phage major capsid protein
MSDLAMRRQVIIDRAKARGATVLNNAETAEFRRLSEEIDHLERRSALSSAANNIFNAATANTNPSPGANMQEQRALQHLTESGVYNVHNQTGVNRRSFIADLMATTIPNADVRGEAAGRLAQHADEMRNSGLEARTGLDTTVGDAGSFSPPAFMIAQYAEYARPVAVTTNLIAAYDLVAPVINIPKITQGSVLSTQSAQNATLNESDIEDEYLQQTAVTIGAKETVSRQLLDLAYPGLDQILFRDLSAAHATFLDGAILSGGGSPSLTGLLSQVGTTIAIPTTGTVIENIYSGLAEALRYVAVNRYLPATGIVMSPSRWYGLLSETDTTGRPLVVATADGNQAFNAVATAVSGAPSAGLSGHLLGTPVFTDAQLPDTDILVARWEDISRYTSGLRVQMSFDTLLGQLSALLVAYSYETLFVRFPQSLVLVTDSESVTYGS